MKVKTHKDICEQMHTVYKAKNADYGDSFSKLRDKFPNAILIRLYDKLNRLETLMTGSSQQVNDESIDDTLLDLANYAVMELVERRVETLKIDAIATVSKNATVEEKELKLDAVKFLKTFKGWCDIASGENANGECLHCPLHEVEEHDCWCWVLDHPIAAVEVMEEWLKGKANEK